MSGDPGTVRHDEVNLRLTNPILASKLRLLSVAPSEGRTDLRNLVRSKFRAAVARAWVSLPSFSCRVAHVVALSTEKQMGRIHARRVVAVVEDRLAGWDRADVVLVGPAMDVDQSSVRHESSVAILINEARPEPTRIKAIDAWAEAIDLASESLLWCSQALMVAAKWITMSSPPSVVLATVPASNGLSVAVLNRTNHFTERTPK